MRFIFNVSCEINMFAKISRDILTIEKIWTTVDVKNAETCLPSRLFHLKSERRESDSSREKKQTLKHFAGWDPT